MPAETKPSPQVTTMDYKEPKTPPEFSRRPNIDPSTYESNDGPWHTSDDHDHLSTMYCPWCSKWTATTTKKEDVKKAILDDLSLIICCLPCYLCCCLAEQLKADIDFHCQQCDARLANRGPKHFKTTDYFLPAGSDGSGSIRVCGGVNEVIASSTSTSRSRTEKIEYACKAADICGALWLNYYHNQTLWIHNWLKLDNGHRGWRSINFSPWVSSLWDSHFSERQFGRSHEFESRKRDARWFMIKDSARAFQGTAPPMWKEEDSPWLVYAAQFLNKEFGPGEELAKAWKEVKERYKWKGRCTDNHLLKLYDDSIQLPKLDQSLAEPCRENSCICRE